jgi:hypothetical protein
METGSSAVMNFIVTEIQRKARADLPFGRRRCLAGSDFGAGPIGGRSAGRVRFSAEDLGS